MAAQRNFGLDLLRAVAILMVLANHALLGFFVWFGHVAWEGPLAGVSILSFLSIEWLFVLSGFLIGTMMIRSFEAGSTWWIRAREFWLRRWFRTVPLYYVFLVVNILATSIGIGQGVYSVKHAFFVQNLVGPEAYPFFYNEAWSLALDEWFYLIMPILVGLAGWGLRLGPRNTFLAVALALIALPALGRALMTQPTNLFEWDYGVRRVTIYHLDATGWGVLGAITSRWWPGFWQRSRRAKAIAGLLFIALGCYLVETQFFGGGIVARFPRLNNTLTLTLLAAGTFLALPWISSLRERKGMLGWGVDRISVYSYSIYLCHIPMMFVLRAALTPEEAGSLPLVWAQTGVWFLLTMALAALIHHSFEKPVSDLRERFTRKVDASPFASTVQPPA